MDLLMTPLNFMVGEENESTSDEPPIDAKTKADEPGQRLNGNNTTRNGGDDAKGEEEDGALSSAFNSVSRFMSSGAESPESDDDDDEEDGREDRLSAAFNSVTRFVSTGGGMIYEEDEEGQDRFSSFADFPSVTKYMNMSQMLRNSTFYAIGGLSLEEIMERREWNALYSSVDHWKAQVCKLTKGCIVEIKTSDGRKLEGIWVPRRYDNVMRTCEIANELPKESAALLFHANAMVGLDMFEYAQWYSHHGMHALIVTMGGYGDSEGESTEISSYLDADAAYAWLRHHTGIPNERIVAHGLSLGAALATALASNRQGVHVTLDQTFVSAQAVAEYVVDSQFEGFAPQWAVTGVISGVFPTGIRQSVAYLPNLYSDDLPVPYGFLSPGSLSSMSSSTNKFQSPSPSKTAAPPPPPEASPLTLPARQQSSTPPRKLSTASSESQDSVPSLFPSPSGFDKSRVFMDHAFASKELDLGVVAYTTDGYDSESKLKQVRGNVFVFSAQTDALMPPTFGPRLVTAKYGSCSKDAPYHHIMPGGHATFFGDQEAAALKYQQYLENLGLIPSKAVLGDIILFSRKTGASKKYSYGFFFDEAKSPQSRMKKTFSPFGSKAKSKQSPDGGVSPDTQQSRVKKRFFGIGKRSPSKKALNQTEGSAPVPIP